MAQQKKLNGEQWRAVRTPLRPAGGPHYISDARVIAERPSNTESPTMISELYARILTALHDAPQQAHHDGYTQHVALPSGVTFNQRR
jgi:hypothetical protein